METYNSGTPKWGDPMTDSFVGAPLPRREDPALVSGRATYTDDLQVPNALHAAFLRSRYGHARIERVETAAAESLDGVVAVFTGDDVAESSAPGAFRVSSSLPDAVETDLPILAEGRVRYAGEPIALVLAEDRYTASDAVDRIDVSYDRIDAVVDPRAATDEGAPTVQEAAPDNVAFDWSFGDEEATRSAFEEADHVVGVDLRNQRLVGDPMEPRAALVEPGGDELTVTLTSQSPFRERPYFAEALGRSEGSIRVIAPSVGGGFGVKGKPYADEIATAWAASAVGRHVKWTSTRSEGHLADYHSRDWYVDGELALDDDGTIRGLRVTGHSNVGAYYVHPPSLTKNFETLISGQYRVPTVHGRMIGTFTHTTPIGIYRGAGRPEVIHFLERLMDTAAAELGMDPAALRRHNQITADAFPYETVVGSVYDSGDYERALDLALESVDYEAWRDRQASLRERGRYAGIGIACFVENSGSSPGMPETSRVEVGADGSVTAHLGTHDHGQGHGTTFAQLLADELDLDYDDVEVVEGDTADLPDGMGTFGSRSAALGGAAMVEAAEAVKARAREVAAEHLEVDADDLRYRDGAFVVAGAPDRSIALREVAEALASAGEPLAATRSYDPPNFGYSFGTHVAVVEVDPGTGEVDFERYVAVDDCGEVINPLVVDGQIQGGIAQGVGQALYEGATYDGSGTLQTGSLQDYTLPKAFHVPEMETHETVTPSPHNPLGVKGTGESGTIAATAAVANAIVDALRPFGVEDVEMPATPETVWRAIHDE